MPEKFVSHLNPPLQPRVGDQLRVLVMTRISTSHQDKLSLDDQAELCKNYVRQHYDRLIEFDVSQHRESGEHRQRQDLIQARRKIESNEVDLIITEDMARISRHITAALEFMDTCQDHDTRLICLNDRVDTGTDCKVLSIISSMHHELHNRDTSERIKRSLDNRFCNGGTLSCLIYGYTKDDGAKTDDAVHKDPAAEPVYDHIFTMLEDGTSYSEVADWLTEQGVPTSPSRTKKKRMKWDGPMVGCLVHNPILKGVRQRGRRITRRRNSTGEHYTVKAPLDHLKERTCPHLAFIEPERYDRIIAMLDARNSKYRRGKHGDDPAAGRPRKRTTWPGQSATCGVCGRPFVWGGHGRTSHMMCSGAKDYCCWNGVTFDGRLAATRIADAVLDAVERLPDFEPGFRALVGQQLAELADTIGQRKRELARRRNDTDIKLRNLMSFVMLGGNQERAMVQQQELMAELATIDIELAKLDRAAKAQPVLPDIAAIKHLARDVFKDLAVNNPAFARRLRKLIPGIQVVPVRCITGGRVLPRACFTLKLGRLFDVVELHDRVDEYLTMQVEVDLFDPPQPVKHLQDILACKACTPPDGKPYTERQIADRVGVTQPVVQKAMKLHQAMEYLGTEDPYEVLTAPPADSNKMRRHRHPRYRFQPLADADHDGHHDVDTPTDADAA